MVVSGIASETVRTRYSSYALGDRKTCRRSTTGTEAGQLAAVLALGGTTRTRAGRLWPATRCDRCGAVHPHDTLGDSLKLRGVHRSRTSFHPFRSLERESPALNRAARGPRPSTSSSPVVWRRRWRGSPPESRAAHRPRAPGHHAEAGPVHQRRPRHDEPRSSTVRCSSPKTAPRRISTWATTSGSSTATQRQRERHHRTGVLGGHRQGAPR